MFMCLKRVDISMVIIDWGLVICYLASDIKGYDGETPELSKGWLSAHGLTN